MKSLNVKSPNVALSISHLIDEEIYSLNGNIKYFGNLRAHPKSLDYKKSLENKEIIKVTRNKKIKVNFFFDKSTRLIECGCGGEVPHNEDLLFNPRLPS